MYKIQPLMYTITRPAAKINVAKMAVKTSFVYAVAVIVFTCVYNVYGQQGATPAPCTTTYYYVSYDYQCNDGNGCYSENDKCNFYNACTDKTDDLNCDSCTHSLSFYCPSSRQCVSIIAVCNGDSDCLNGEDEDVTFCSTYCGSSMGDYPCKDGNGCYSDYDKCDSRNACSDKTDDLDCDSCTHSLSFYCPSSRQCVSKSLVCNGDSDCLNGEDEDVTFCSTYCPYDYGDYPCKDKNGCYSDYEKCDGYNDCNDKTDDLDCDGCTDSLSFYCVSSRQCVGKSLLCDGNTDCLNGEDEDVKFCSTHCTSGYGDYSCKDRNGCYSDYDKCDGYNDCNDKTDELNCDSCVIGFYCEKSRQCVFTHSVCDGHQDCIHGEDENLPGCNPTIWMFWSGGQIAGIVIGYVIFLVIVIAIVVVVHKNCKNNHEDYQCLRTSHKSVCVSTV